MLIFLLTFAVLFEVGSGQMVRQCTCAELDQCKQQAMEQIVECAMECQSQMKQTNVAKAPAIIQCIVELKNSGDDIRECFASLKDRICTNQTGTMIPSQPEGFGPFGGGLLQALRQRVMGGGEVQESHPFLFCMKQCRQKTNKGEDQPPIMTCQRQLGCSILKPSMFEMFQVMSDCRAKIQAKKQILCDCLVQNGQQQLCQVIQNHQRLSIFD